MSRFHKHASKNLWNSCLRKNAYATREDAEAQIPLIPNQFKAGKLHVYLCDFAQHYHIGHSS